VVQACELYGLDNPQGSMRLRAQGLCDHDACAQLFSWLLWYRKADGTVPSLHGSGRSMQHAGESYLVQGMSQMCAWYSPLGIPPVKGLVWLAAGLVPYDSEHSTLTLPIKAVVAMVTSAASVNNHTTSERSCDATPPRLVS
jgi:hypothetical protein